MLQLGKKKKKRWKCRKCRRTNGTRIQTSSRSLSACLDSGYCAWTVAGNFDFSAIFNTSVGPVYCSRDPQISLFSNFFIKNGFHGTSHLFKNGFATVFSVFSFSKISSIQTDPRVQCKNVGFHVLGLKTQHLKFLPNAKY